MDPLSEILDVEQEIARRLADERAKAGAWLADARAAAATSAADAIARLNAQAAADEHAARETAAATAAKILTRARALAARLQALDDDQLRSFVLKHIAAIAPGPSRDRQDVEDRSDRPEGSAAARSCDDSPH